MGNTVINSSTVSSIHILRMQKVMKTQVLAPRAKDRDLFIRSVYEIVALKLLRKKDIYPDL